MVCDDHAAVREGVRRLLEHRRGWSVVAQAAIMREARSRRPLFERSDVAIMNVRYPDGSGIEACRVIRQVRPKPE